MGVCPLPHTSALSAASVIPRLAESYTRLPEMERAGIEPANARSSAEWMVPTHPITPRLLKRRNRLTETADARPAIRTRSRVVTGHDVSHYTNQANTPFESTYPYIDTPPI